MNTKKLMLVIFAGLALSGTAHAGVYKCKDAAGKTVYSDNACGEDKQEVQNLRGNTMQAERVQRPTTANSQQAYRSAPEGSVCPSAQEIKNLETSASSVTLKRQEREFMQAEVRRARACSKEGGNYNADDWKRIQEAQSAQNNLTSESRQAARASAESEHARSASEQEQGRMRTDKLIQEQRSSQRQRQAAAQSSQLVNCDKAGCWSTDGQRYNNAAGGNFIRSDGVFCVRNGPVVTCN